MKDTKLIFFSEENTQNALPEKFTFPFFYTPHPLAKIAAFELQNYLESQQDWLHNFGLEKNMEGLVIGKMFGVLVVKTQNNELGYLCAFSGKLADSNHHERFVPPVYDMLVEGDFFQKEGKNIIALNQKLNDLEKKPEYLNLLVLKQEKTTQFQLDFQKQKQNISLNKIKRAALRQNALGTLSKEELISFLKQLDEQSASEQILLKKFKKRHLIELETLEKEIKTYELQIKDIKDRRKELSIELQNKLFRQYAFLNAKREVKNLLEIFADFKGTVPPAGAGECCAPKLLHYSYLYNYTPICMAEFWWGESPQSEIRKHKHYYPSCRSKCEPILGHMLNGLELDENPMLKNPAEGKNLEIIYEDESILVINKPAEFLSVPGKEIEDSVFTRIKKIRPHATGPIIVHRLDMSTSGIMLLAKNKYAHDFLQRQFIKRKIKKRYVALLNGKLNSEKGEIKLPLRVDLDNRPQQLVCFEHGKTAHTLWEKISEENGYTRVYFYPLTGRTHQLRVHASHSLGLNIPIVGDDLYGTIKDRLYLHAESIEFTHPESKKSISFQLSPDF